MNKSIGYYFEKYSSSLLGISIVIIYLCYQDCFLFVFHEKILDRLISICSTMFGFLLTVLALIIQSDSKAIILLKSHTKYSELVDFNKKIVVSSIIVVILSLILPVINLVTHNQLRLNILIAINYGIFTSVVIDTLIFTYIFYLILKSK